MKFHEGRGLVLFTIYSVPKTVPGTEHVIYKYLLDGWTLQDTIYVLLWLYDLQDSQVFGRHFLLIRVAIPYL